MQIPQTSRMPHFQVWGVQYYVFMWNFAVADLVGGATGTRALKFDRLWFFCIPFCMRMLDNKAQIAREGIKNPDPGPPPPHSVLFRVRIYACSLPLKAPPYLRTDKISEPPYRGLFAGFSCLGDPPKSKHCSMYPLYCIWEPPFAILQASKEREKEKPPPFYKKSPGEKSNTPLFYNSRAGLCRTKSTPLPEILGTRMRSLRPRSGGGGAGDPGR